MSLPQRLLFDMNAIRYLHQLGLLEICIRGIDEPATSDLIQFREMKKPSWAEIEPFGIKALELTSDMLGDAASLLKEKGGVSIYDTSLIVLAKRYGCPVFTEDHDLILLMKRQNVDHMSLPKILDCMVDAGLISFDDAVMYLKRVANELLPKSHSKYLDIFQKYSV